MLENFPSSALYVSELRTPKSSFLHIKYLCQVKALLICIVSDNQTADQHISFTVEHRGMETCCSPAYSTGLTVILLFVLVKQVANITVIFSKLYMAALTGLLCL